MVVHQDIGIEDHGRGVQAVGQLCQKSLAVGVAVEYDRPAVAAAGDVVNGIGEINSRRAGHGVGRGPRCASWSEGSALSLSMSTNSIAPTSDSAMPRRP